MPQFVQQKELIYYTELTKIYLQLNLNEKVLTGRKNGIRHFVWLFVIVFLRI